jgi:hypothetical protein
MRECHDIRKRDVQVGLEMAWHKLTKVVDVIGKENCGLIYPMSMQRLNLPDGNQTDFYAIVSDDDGKAIGDSVREGYKLISNEQIWDTVAEALKGSSHKIVSSGSVSGRSKCFMSIKVAEDFIAANRLTQNTLNIIWGHGGTVSVIGRSAFHAIVCRNTFNLALKRGKKGDTDFSLSVRHTGNADVKIANLGEAIDKHYGVVAEFQKAMDDVAAQSVNHTEAKQFFAGFLVRDEDPKEIAERTSNRIDRLMELFRFGEGNSGKDRADVFNAITDFYTHESSGGENQWRQFESSEFGSGNTRKSEAYKLLVNPDVSIRDVGNYASVVARGDKVLQLI